MAVPNVAAELAASTVPADGGVNGMGETMLGLLRGPSDWAELLERFVTELMIGLE